jgi:hypothetical protein
VIRRAERRLGEITWVLGGGFVGSEIPRPFGRVGVDLGEASGYGWSNTPLYPVRYDVEEAWDNTEVANLFGTASFDEGWDNRGLYKID